MPPTATLAGGCGAASDGLALGTAFNPARAMRAPCVGVHGPRWEARAGGTRLVVAALKRSVAPTQTRRSVSTNAHRAGART